MIKLFIAMLSCVALGAAESSHRVSSATTPIAAAATTAAAVKSSTVAATPFAAIQEMIVLLKAKQYKLCIETYASPSIVNVINLDNGMEEFVQQFADGKAASILEQLSACVETDLIAGRDDDHVVLPAKNDSHSEAHFVRIDGRWYVEN